MARNHHKENRRKHHSRANILDQAQQLEYVPLRHSGFSLEVPNRGHDVTPSSLHGADTCNQQLCSYSPQPPTLGKDAPGGNPLATASPADGLDALLEGLSGSDLQTAKLVVKALRSPEDLAILRRMAVIHGFINDRIRAVVWPRLLGIPPLDCLPGGLTLGRHPCPPLCSGSPTPTSKGTAPISEASPTLELRQQPLSPHHSGSAERQGVGVAANATAAPASPNGNHGSAAGGFCAGFERFDAADGHGEPSAASPIAGGAPGLRNGNGKDFSASGCLPRDSMSSGGGGSYNGSVCERNGSDGGDDSEQGMWDAARYLHWSRQAHRDSSVVEVDVARSLWAFTRDLSDEQREGRRRQLKRLLNAAVTSHAGDVFYYQGLHDVAGVLLLSLPHTLPQPAGPAQPQQTPPPQSAQAASELQEPSAPDTVSGTGHRRKSRRHRTRSHGSAAEPASVAATAPSSHTPAGSAVPGNDGITRDPCALPSPAAAVAATTAGDAPIAAGGADDDAVSGGELLAFALLRRLVTSHLRDATRPTLEPVVQLLGLLPHLVAAADPPLARHLAAAGLQPFFALSWFLTWWAHELDSLPPASRLFDFFLASHPLMPLYLGAVAMRSQRGTLLALSEMPELHSALTNLKLVPTGVGGGVGAGAEVGGSVRQRLGSSGSGARVWASVRGGVASGRGRREEAALDQLLRAAQELFRARPPHAILPLRPTRGSLPAPATPPPSRLRRRHAAGDVGAGHAASPAPVLSACVAHATELERSSGLWLVPREAPAEWPPGPLPYYGGEGRTGLSGLFSRASSVLTSGRSRSALLSGALLAGVYVAAAVAIGYATLARTADGTAGAQQYEAG